MHTLWMREFNRIVGELHGLNPAWDPERLYQTARKIVGAQMQHVVYNEWLPAVVGRNTMRRHGLSLNEVGIQKPTAKGYKVYKHWHWFRYIVM